MPDPKSTTITIRVSHELFEKLKEASDKDERTLSQYCMLILKRHIESLKKE